LNTISPVQCENVVQTRFVHGNKYPRQLLCTSLVCTWKQVSTSVIMYKSGLYTKTGFYGSNYVQVWFVQSGNAGNTERWLKEGAIVLGRDSRSSREWREAAR